MDLNSVLFFFRIKREVPTFSSSYIFFLCVYLWWSVVREVNFPVDGRLEDANAIRASPSETEVQKILSESVDVFDSESWPEETIPNFGQGHAVRVFVWKIIPGGRNSM